MSLTRAAIPLKSGKGFDSLLQRERCGLVFENPRWLQNHCAPRKSLACRFFFTVLVFVLVQIEPALTVSLSWEMLLLWFGTYLESFPDLLSSMNVVC